MTITLVLILKSMHSVFWTERGGGGVCVCVNRGGGTKHRDKYTYAVQANRALRELSTERCKTSTANLRIGGLVNR